MGFKTTFSSAKGIETVPVDGASKLVFESVEMQTQKFEIAVVDEDGSDIVSSPFTLFRPTTAVGVTASLPAITSANLGTQYSILKNAGTNPVLVSGTNNITDGGDWDVEISTTGQTYKVLSVSGSNGYYWHVV